MVGLVGRFVGPVNLSGRLVYRAGWFVGPVGFFRPVSLLGQLVIRLVGLESFIAVSGMNGKLFSIIRYEWKAL